MSSNQDLKLDFIRLWLKDQTTGRSETFGQVKGHVESLCTGLVEIGVSAGDVVCVWCSNYVEFWLICLAVWELGGVTLGVNCLITHDKLIEQLKETGAAVLVCDTFNVEEGVKSKGEVESLKQVLLIGQVRHEPKEGFVNFGISGGCPGRVCLRV